ncbi:MAG: cyclic nucleotide-binding domain-containing protein [Acidimicrobiales bacterium]
MVLAHPHPFRRPLGALGLWRTWRDGKVRRVVRHPLFAGLPLRQAAAVAAMLDVTVLGPGAVLVQQGSHAVESFVIVSGTAEVEIDGIPIGLIDSRQTVGVAARANSVLHGATVRALTEMELFVLAPRRLRPFVEVVPHAIGPDWADQLPLAVPVAVG